MTEKPNVTVSLPETGLEVAGLGAVERPLMAEMSGGPLMAEMPEGQLMAGLKVAWKSLMAVLMTGLKVA